RSPSRAPPRGAQEDDGGGSGRQVEEAPRLPGEAPRLEVMLPRTYKVVTLGCKLNQFDSASIEGQLRARGFREAEGEESAGIYVVNTCTVTENADREARRLARRGRRENPGCRLLVTGCYAELDRDALARIAGIDEIIGHSDRERIPAVLDRIA